MIKSLSARQHELARAIKQVGVLSENKSKMTPFELKLGEQGLFPLKPTELEIFQMNLGKMCNQVCAHCHVDAGPDRKEIMTKETMDQCIEVLRNTKVNTVDLTGGAPEMNPNFRYLVEQVSDLGIHIIDRCNLTIIVANKKYHDLPEFLAKHKVEVVSSMPHYTPGKTDRQRGDGVFDRSIKALQMLNEAGYGMEGSGLELNLVYNPSGAFLPGDQDEMEAEFKHNLRRDFGIEFNKLFAITNLPISRFLDFLLQKELFEDYMERLIDAYNPAAANSVMCRNTLSISWDGYLYDCDFNQMLELKVDSEANHISNFDLKSLNSREIILNQHCYGCTAGAGSSCGGQTA
ncbi:arsenosugar biosynthesis radical SAM (seleno)protein ArsS [Luteibaculum oceani]|uniref:Radical SAM/Cys-rich domain protein n=1 Tax=Luteibaculum oceani TaxID=1294296 RepID=A0A5C6UVM6_9FLAO|nr:arsenosugar biosynthesis radical SAM (seleno)protein ArsS [Luteibaculum oceani]TXC76186.1 radical SAM/Cys-rich domain protein [Luteibaculum oceani]